MITPQFTLDQTETHLIVRIQVPHIRVSLQSVEVVITDGSVVHFGSPPYLLVLNFAGIDSSTPQSSEISRLSPSSSSIDDVATSAAAAAAAAGDASSSVFADDAEEECAQYDPTRHDGTLVLRLVKRVPAHWRDLHLVGRFLASSSCQPTVQSPSSSSRWLQEVVASEPRHEEDAVVEDHTAEGSDLPPQPSSLEGDGNDDYGYGFAHMFRDVLHHDWSKDAMAKEMLEGWEHFWSTHRPPTAALGGRTALCRRHLRRKRLQVENDAFSIERFLQDADVDDDYVYQCAMSMEPHWSVPFVDFTAEETLQLATIPYPLLPPSVLKVVRQDPGDDGGPNSVAASSTSIRRLLLGLVDLLYAYVYDHLTTSGDPTVESAWTIVVLSPTLSWLDDSWEPAHDNDEATDAGTQSEALDDSEESADSVEAVLRSSMRRSLVYPYLRNLDLSVRCVSHVSQILSNGRECVIRCLLQVRSILHKSDLYYLSNKLYIDPYLAWLQQFSDEASHVLGRGLNQMSDQVAAAVHSTTSWWDEMNLPSEHPTDAGSESLSEEEDDDDSTNSSGASRSSDISSKSTDAEENASKRSARMGGNLPGTNILPALQTLSLNDNASTPPSGRTHSSLVAPTSRIRSPLIQELD